MKKFYTSPELEISLLTVEDILQSSPGTDNEVFINAENIFGSN